MTGRHILLVDDDDDLREALTEQLGLYEEFSVAVEASATKGIQAARAEHVDLLIMDVGLPDMDGRALTKLSVRRRPGQHSHHGLLIAGNQAYPCLLGRGGIGINKYEGDGKTPIGEFSLLSGFYRTDRIKLAVNNLAIRAIVARDGWCDAPGHPSYNRLIKKPFSASHESMCRRDHLYDICLVMDYNIAPRVRNRGSAIFFHLASYQDKATEGCIAVSLPVMQKLLPQLAKNVVVRVLN